MRFMVDSPFLVVSVLRSRKCCAAVRKTSAIEAARGRSRVGEKHAGKPCESARRVTKNRAKSRAYFPDDCKNARPEGGTPVSPRAEQAPILFQNSEL
jgi:hypothetical protein